MNAVAQPRYRTKSGNERFDLFRETVADGSSDNDEMISQFS